MPEDVYEERKDEIDDFLFDDPTPQSIAALDPSLKNEMYVVQVKSRGKLRDTYSHVGAPQMNLEDILEKDSLDRRFFDGIDSTVLEETRAHRVESEGVLGSRSQAMVFSCDVLSGKERRFVGNLPQEQQSKLRSFDKRVQNLVSDVQELGMFMGKKDTKTMYVFVDSGVAEDFYGT